MYQSINSSECHRGVLKDFPPFAEGLIRGDENGTAFVSSADQLEQHGGFRLVFGDIDQIVQNQQVMSIQALDGSL